MPDIARQVLEDNGLGATFRLEGSYPEHDYAAQYNETDFAFLQRVLLEERDLLLLRARRRRPRAGPRRRPRLRARDAGTFPFDDGNASRVEPARVLSWEKTQELTPGKVTLRDHHFALPDSPLEGTATIVPAVQAGQVTHVLRLPASDGLELYDYPGGYAERFDGAEPGDLQQLDQAPTRAAALRIGCRRRPRGRGRRRRLDRARVRPGATFGLSGHGNGDGAYLLTAVQHSASQPAGANGDVGFSYANSFTCIPAGVPYRPPRTTADRSVARPQTAVVVGPGGRARRTPTATGA